jgi:hypothetical protein
MRIKDIQFFNKKYALYTNVIDETSKHGFKRFIDENVTVHEMKVSENNYRIKLIVGNGNEKWISVDNNCKGFDIINDCTYNYELKELDY